MKELHGKHVAQENSAKRASHAARGPRVGKGMPRHANVAEQVMRTRNAAVRFGAAGALSVVLLGAGVAPQLLVVDPVYADDQAVAVAVAQNDAAGGPMIEGSAEKQEVVYASMSATGAVKQLFVVSTLFSDAAAMVKDYGAYSDVLNLTDETALGLEPDSVVCVIEEETFSYQGTLASSDLPWLVNITYELDGKAISPADLAGKSGELKISIDTLQNTAIDPIYFDNYLLQITCTLPMEKATKVVTDDGSIALAGSNTTVTFSGMPGKEGSYVLTAQVKDFEMDGISIAAIPFSMALDMPDADSLVSQFDELIDGSAKLDDGALKLKEGTAALDGGAKKLAGGVDELQAGSEELSASVSVYVAGVKKIAEGASAIKDVADGLARLKPLTDAYKNMPALTGSEMEALSAAIAASSIPPEKQTAMIALLGQLGNIGTYASGVDAATSGLAKIASGLDPETIKKLSDGGDNLVKGIEGLNGGIGELANNADSFTSGAGQLAEGAAQLQDGTAQLHQESQGIPDKVRSEIDALMSDYDKSDFTPKSFVDARNTGVDLVQFVMTAEAIQLPDVKAEEPEPEEMSILDRLFALFS